MLAEVLLTAKGCDHLGPGSQTGERRPKDTCDGSGREWWLLAFPVGVGGQECHMHSYGRLSWCYLSASVALEESS